MMNKIIKERLALIQSGTMPHGYKKTKAGIMPEDWDGAVRAKDVFKNHTDKKHNGDLEILAATQENGIVPRSQIGIDIQCSEEGVNGYKKVSKGDFVISLRSFQGGIEYSEYDGIVSPSYTVLQPIREISDGYYRNYFKTDSFIQRLNGSVYGIRDGKQIGYQDFGDMYIHCPPIDEQKKIAEVLSCCNRVIELKQQLIAEMQRLKSGFLQAMFPAKGHSEPDIRFPEFSGDWEQRKLLDCVEKITDFRGRTPKKLGMDWSESGYLALSALNVKDGYIDFTQDIHYGNQELYDKWMTGNELHKGQVLFTTEAPMGNVAQVPDNRQYILSQRTIAFSVKEDLITENFLATILRSPNVIATLTALSSGGTAKGVSQKSLSTVEIIIPNDLGEQERLANTFLELDHLITLHQRELEEAKKKKKSLAKLLLTGSVRVPT